jgi:spore coat polysaccharide biosynthesis protein SpsF
LAEVEKTYYDAELREHVPLHFFKNQDRYRIIHLIAPGKLHEPKLRLVLDYPEDLELIRNIYKNLEPIHGGVFGLNEIISLLQENTSLRKINSHLEADPVL